MSILSNKIALVTDAESKLGKAIIEELVLKGLKVIGLSSDINKLKVRLTLFNSIKKMQLIHILVMDYLIKMILINYYL